MLLCSTPVAVSPCPAACTGLARPRLNPLSGLNNVRWVTNAFGLSSSQPLQVLRQARREQGKLNSSGSGPARRWQAIGTMLLAAALCTSAAAEKADRTKPVVVEADQGGSIDLQRQLLVYTGNVVVVQGTMQLRAERIEMRQTPDGHRIAVALGQAGKPATWRQKRDGLDETVEGSADRIEFDGKADTLRLSGKSIVRRLRGAVVADEISGNNILWDNGAELFRVEGGASTPGNPGGRVRAVLSPRVEAAVASPAAASSPSLTPSRALGDRR